ncbi:MAG: hypothetical protein QXM53_10510 [Thermofilaceae archaeon]
MSQTQVQIQTQNPQTQPKLKLKEVIFKYNISNKEIENMLSDLIIKSVEDGTIKALTYMYSTWGSCRKWKLVVTTKNGEYLPGEWVDRSSRKNPHKYKYTDINDLPNEIKIYYFESPSCNPGKRFKFMVLAEVEKREG